MLGSRSTFNNNNSSNNDHSNSNTTTNNNNTTTNNNNNNNALMASSKSKKTKTNTTSDTIANNTTTSTSTPTPTSTSTSTSTSTGLTALHLMGESQRLQQIEENSKHHMEALNNELVRAHKQIASLKETNTTLSARNEYLDQDLVDMDKHNQSLNEEFVKLSAQHEEFKRTILNLNQATTSQDGELEQQLASLIAEKTNFKRAHAELTAQQGVQSELNEKEVLCMLHDQLLKDRKHLDETTALTQTINEKTETISSLQSQLEEALANFDRMREEHKTEHTQLTEFKHHFDTETQVMEAELEKGHMQSKTAAMGYETQLHTIQTAMKMKETQLNTVQNEMDAKNTLCAELTQQLRQVQQEVHRLEMTQHNSGWVEQSLNDQKTQTTTHQAVLSAKEEELESVRLAFEEERRTFAHTLKAEQQTKDHLLEQQSAQTSLVQRKCDIKLQEAKREIDDLKHDLDEAVTLRIEAQNELEQLTTSFEEEQVKIGAEFEASVDETHAKFNAAVTKLKIEHETALRVISSEKVKLEQALLVSREAEQQQRESFDELCSEFENTRTELGRSRSELATIKTETTILQTSDSQKRHAENRKLTDVLSQHKRVLESAERYKQMLNDIQLEQETNLDQHTREIEQARETAQTELTQYASIVNKLQMRLQESQTEISRRDESIRELKQRVAGLCDNTQTLEHEFAKARELEQMHHQELTLTFEKKNTIMQAQLAEEKKIFEDLCVIVAERYHQLLRMDAVVEGSFNQTTMSSFTSPAEQLMAMESMSRSKTERLQQTLAQEKDAKTKVKELESKLFETERQVQAEKTIGQRTSDKLSLSSSSARQEQNRFNELLASVRKGFEKEKSNFQDQIASARLQTVKVTEELATARSELKAKEERIDYLDQKVTVAEETNAGYERKCELQKQQIGEITRLSENLRTELSRKASELAVTQAELRTEISRREEAQAREEAVRTELELSEKTAEQLRMAVGSAATLQQNTDAALARAKLNGAASEEGLTESTARNTILEETAAQMAVELNAWRTQADQQEREISSLSLSLEQALVEQGLVNKLKAQLQSLRQVMDSELASRDDEVSRAEDELAASQSKTTRLKRLNAGKVADLERQLAMSQQKVQRSSEALQVQNKKSKQLREHLSQIQLKHEGVSEAVDVLRRAEERSKLIIEDLETANAQLKQQTNILTDQVERHVSRINDLESTRKNQSMRMTSDLTTKFQQQERARKNLEKLREESSNATKRDFEQKISSMQGQVESLNASLRSPTRSPTRPTRRHTATSTPRKY